MVFFKLLSFCREKWRWLLSCLLVFGSAALGATVHRVSFVRFWQALKDLLSAGVYYFYKSFSGFDLQTTVNDLPAVDLKKYVGFDVEELSRRIGAMWGYAVKPSSFSAYSETVLLFLYNVLYWFLTLAPLFICVCMLVRRKLMQETHKHPCASWQLRFVRRCLVPFRALWRWFCSYASWVRFHSLFFRLLLLIWLANFNFFTIVFNFAAWYLYFAGSLSLQSLFPQLVRLLVDLIVMFSRAPWVFWVGVGYLILDLIRRTIGYSRLDKKESANREWMEGLNLVVMICGAMGKGKTSVAVDMMISWEIMFREKAEEQMQENALRFRRFPWVQFERDLRDAIDNGVVYNLRTARSWVRACRDRFMTQPCMAYCFGYDCFDSSMKSDDGLLFKDLWEVLESYAQQYVIYVLETSLVVSNLGVRVDCDLDDLGNFPRWDHDIFHRPSVDFGDDNQHSHILDYDMLRLGKKMLDGNEKAGAFEFGVVGVTEIGKERGNQLELQEVKRGADEANQKNDLLNYWLKLVRHPSTVDGFPYLRVVTDEQRPESWGADARDLCDILRIKNRSERRCLMPFYFLGDILYDWLTPKFTEARAEYRYYRDDETLIGSICKTLYGWFYDHHKKIYNTFGVMVAEIEQSAGTLEGDPVVHDYFLMSKKIYADRYSTDCYREYFASAGAQIGLADLPMYRGTCADADELLSQNSYFVRDLFRVLDSEKKQKKYN